MSDVAKSVVIVGVGLIGGSIAAALRRAGFPGRIVGVTRDAVRLQPAVDDGLIDAATEDLGVAAAEGDLLVFCTPVDRIVSAVRQAARHARPGTLITDAGSVKQSICDPLTDGLPTGVCFVGSHPLAGSEKQGFASAQADLFEDRICVLTPHSQTPAAALQRLRAFWEQLGARVCEMTPAAHDLALAHTSHLPHFAAVGLAGLLQDSEKYLTATGFRDTTRIAAGDPGLWSAIALGNRKAIVAALDEYCEAMHEIRDAIAREDAERLKKLLQVAKRNRISLDDS